MEENLKAVVALANRLCRANGVMMDAIELAYLASLLEHQGAWAGSNDSDSSSSDNSSKAALGAAPLSPTEVQLLAQQLSERALAQDPTERATMQLQIALESAQQQQQQQVEEELQQQADKVAAHLRAATRNLHTSSSPADHDKVFSKVLDSVCAKGGLDRALPGGDEGARQEVYAALESAFPLSGMARYCSQPQADKEAQLEVLARVTVGILLFNQSKGAGGSALPAGAAIYMPQAQRLLREVTRTAAELRCAYDAANRRSSNCSSISRNNSSSSSNRRGSNDSSSSSSQAPLPVAPRALYAAQALVAVERMASDLQGGLGACEVLTAAVDQGLAAAQGLVGASAAVSKEQVFPVFEQLGVVHAALGQELRLLVVRQRLFDTLEALLRGASNGNGRSSSSSSISSKGVAPLLASNGRSSSAGRSSVVATSATAAAAAPLDEQAIADLPSDVEYIPPEAVSGRGSTIGQRSSSGGSSSSYSLPADVALAGLCPWSVAQRGVLGLQLGVMAQPSVGCLRYGGRTYSFSSTKALLSFAQQPAAVLQRVEELAHAQPLLHHLLGLATQQQQLEEQEEQQEQQAQQMQSQPSMRQREQEQEKEQQDEPQAELRHLDGQAHVTDSMDSQAVSNSTDSLLSQEHQQQPEQHEEQQEQQQEPADEVPAAESSCAASDAAAGADDGDAASEATTDTPSSTADAPDGSDTSAPATTADSAAAAGSPAQQPEATAAAAAPPVAAPTKQPLPSLRFLMGLMAAAPLKVEMGTQTPTHFVERHIDVNYEWNEWALKRRIIALANLRKKATHSTQTALSHFRRDGDTQTWAPKQATSQTPVTKGQAMPKKLRYVAGLRGAPGTKMNVVSLELELGQPHQF